MPATGMMSAKVILYWAKSDEGNAEEPSLRLASRGCSQFRSPSSENSLEERLRLTGLSVAPRKGRHQVSEVFGEEIVRVAKRGF